MGDEKNAQKKPDAEGKNIAAAQPLCGCGIRGCNNAAEHAQAFSPRKRTIAQRSRAWRRR